ncbi:type VI secretion system protein TssL, short form [Scandinavium sp. H11S7]|jgi:type VI secretion system protein ImpK|uniref:type VI secretion system protein TssL, short form n=1 Tax=Scandinavium hiltneri TaxID=2926519 RepID=UPI000D7BE75C|nr:type VI secretion system protein TssL, short form [Scandinavium hiltneri]MCS2157971.1 type VI secretion system protein TssL, short form [Scandinavium hiltneri]
MKNNPTSFIDQMFYPGWLMVSQLRNGQEITDGKALYRRTCEWLDGWRTQLEEQGIPQSSSDHLLYTLCALFDESVLNRGKQDDGYNTWLANPLQAKYFNTLNAGEELWERIRTVLQEPSPDIAVLTCFSRALTLGFVGRYRQQADERREDVVRNLSQRVPPFTLTEEAPIVARAGRLRSGRRFYWLSWAAGFVLLGTVWFLLSTSLQQMVSAIAGVE